eukprot:sb/3465965/
MSDDGKTEDVTQEDLYEDYVEEEGDCVEGEEDCIEAFPDDEECQEQADDIERDGEEEEEDFIHDQDDRYDEENLYGDDVAIGEEEDGVQIHNEEMDFSHEPEDEEEEDREDREDREDDNEKEKEDDQEGAPKDEEKEEKEKEIECTLTEEEKLEEMKYLDQLQEQIDLEHYDLRKLRSTTNNFASQIERLRKKVTVYTNDKEDDKAMATLQKIAELSKDRENASNARRETSDKLAELKKKRSDHVKELKEEKGFKVDNKRTFLIEDTRQRELQKTARSVLKHGSMATLKLSLDELDAVIVSLLEVSNDIDRYLCGGDAVRRRYVNRMTRYERRLDVLYDKLLQWRVYKGKQAPRYYLSWPPVS